MTSDYQSIWKPVIANLVVSEKSRPGIYYQNSSVKSCNGSLFTDSFKLETIRAVNLMCVTYKSSQFIVITFEGFA